MDVFFGLLALFVLLALGCIAVQFTSRMGKVGVSLLVLVLLGFAAALLLPDDKQAASATPSTPVQPSISSAGKDQPRESITTTLRNYRYQGDSIKLECSGPTGNIKCKPVP